MKISPKSTFIYATLIITLVGLMIGIILVETQEKAWAIAFFVWLMIGSVALYKVRCPNCGTSLAFQGKIGGLSLYAGFARSKCQDCGYDLRKR